MPHFIVGKALGQEARDERYSSTEVLSHYICVKLVAAAIPEVSSGPRGYEGRLVKCFIQGTGRSLIIASASP